MKVGKHLYDYVKYRSGAEKEFIERLEASKEVAVCKTSGTILYLHSCRTLYAGMGDRFAGKRKENVSLLLGKSRKR